jgi:hypothetical protein
MRSRTGSVLVSSNVYPRRPYRAGAEQTDDMHSSSLNPWRPR